MHEPSRHQLGQWFTPEDVADIALSLAHPRASWAKTRLLDPSCGDGVFLRRALARGAKDVHGVDIDARALAAARTKAEGAKLRHADFFSAGELGAFDVIVGNPPYVRQERLQGADKERMVEELCAAWPELGRASLDRLVGRGDLAAPFLLKALRHRKPGGRAALVISSAFFDSGYGAQFWELAEQVASLQLVVDAPRERWFADAAVNAVIAVFGPLTPETEPRFARLQVSTEEASKRLRAGAPLEELAAIRSARRSEPGTWAAALRAPDAWFRFAAEAGEELCALGEVAELRRGITTGANDIFYLERSSPEARDLNPRFLKPLLQAPGRAGQPGIEVETASTRRVALVIPADTDLQSYPDLRRYLERFPEADTRATLATRRPWWALPARPAQVFLGKAYAERFVQPYSPEPMLADQRVYCVHPNPGIEAALLAAILNGSATALALESLGRASMGQGALEWTVADAARLPILDPRRVRDTPAILAAFAQLCRREIGSLQEELARADRIALDRALLGSFAPLREPVCEALVQTCAARMERAR